MESDEETVRRVLAGDAEAFRAIVERWQKPLWAMARRLVRDLQAAEDATQDAFVSAYEHLRDFDPKKAAFSTWLFTIARNRCLTVAAKRVVPTAADLPDLPGGENPIDRLETAESWALLDAALESLPREQKNAFVMREFSGLEYAEIAAIEGVEEGTVRSRISRAKSALRAAVGEIVRGDS